VNNRAFSLGGFTKICGKGLDLLAVEALEHHNIQNENPCFFENLKKKAGENLWLIPDLQGSTEKMVTIGE